ncbi:DNA adenine methylase [Dethiosulfovibrio salsuginis]|uniref:site-specific DNA-methyltransferase (adenine-specific) n=1 Tax=Dethiosulfovibrio salsuginis TaxID=561720 RepID=A0A1X7KHW7_9BACT|nr:DNA adenine methylase [Dethiosulfovibrio salsuginis]SMG40624.1 DNA adenine methylase [Dethiosulfovibrio salsuginis]
MPFYTPLRYPGGKRKLVPFIENLIEANHLIGINYIEPYAGGAALALQLLFDGYASTIHINDLNASVFSFWNAVLNHTEALSRKIHDTHVSMEEWFRQKEIQANASSLVGSMDLAFSTFFLNRTNRSGIIKGGVIGGKNQEGEWKLDARFKKDELVRRIQNIAAKRDKIKVTRMDAVKLIEQLPQDSRNFLYLDPPYYKKGQGLYDNFYGPDDHKTVSQALERITIPWAISYDNTPEIRVLYKDYKSLTYSLSYTAQEKADGSEFLAVSEGLSFPQKANEKQSFGCMRNVQVAV